MAFFQNSKPNSIAGISLPTDGSDTLTVHLKADDPSYSEDCMFFLSLSGASCFNTSGGCMVTYAKHSDVADMLEKGKHYFDPKLIDAVNAERYTIINSHINSPFDDNRRREIARKLTRRPVANQTGPAMEATCVNIRTHLMNLQP